MKYVLFVVAVLFLSDGRAGDIIPPKAYIYKHDVKKAIDEIYPTIFNYNYIPALAEHESCITLKHKRCWDPSSRLSSKRELGAGLFQVTKTFREDGSIRFDVLSEMKAKYKQELKDVSWDNIFVSPTGQIKIAVLMIRDLNKSLYSVTDQVARAQFVDAAYNGGLGGVIKERRACSLAPNCDANKWFANVENYCSKSKKPLYGNRSACDINRHHVKDVFKNKLPKYDRLYFVKEV